MVCVGKGFGVRLSFLAFVLAVFALASGNPAFAGSNTMDAPILTCEAEAKTDPVLLNALCTAVQERLSASYPGLQMDKTKGALGDIRLVIATADARRITAYLAQVEQPSGTLRQGPTLGMSVVDTQMAAHMMDEFADFLIEEAKLQ